MFSDAFQDASYHSENVSYRNLLALQEICCKMVMQSRQKQRRRIQDMNMIKVQNLTKMYGDFCAVDHISFEVKRASTLGFLGINGAGKSTTINMLSTLLTPDEGSAQLCGYTAGREDHQIRRRIGIVYQQNCLDDLLSVKENLMTRGILHGASKKEAAVQLKRLSGMLNLDNILNKKYRTLSGGQKRRCEIAAALMHTPEILFLDEPTTGLDPATRANMWETLKELQKREKITIFLTTHYMEEAAGADNIIILDHGKIITSGTAFELKEKYAADKLRLYFDETDSAKTKEIAAAVLEAGMRKKIVRLKNKGIEIPIHATMDALPVLEAVREKIDGFEVIQGNMDDVFLNAVERNGEQDGEI